MAKPWERYSQPEQSAAGPWAKYGGETDARQRPVQTREQKIEAQRRKDAEELDPTKGMSKFEQGRAGFFESFVNTAQGLKQTGAESVSRHAQMLAGGLKAAGLDSAADAVARRAVAPAMKLEREVQREVDDTRRLQGPLDETGAGMAGNVAGNITQLLGPGLALRGTTAGRLLLPTTIRGNAAQGAVLGGLQPVASGESRGAKAALGGAVGAVVPAALKAPGAVVRGAKNLARSPEERAAREAVEVIQREAGNFDLMTPKPSQLPGATRTLFEETQSPGVARLETKSRGSAGTNWVGRDIAENEARVNALRQFAGDEAAIAEAQRARSVATGELRNQAFAEGDAVAQRAAEQRMLIPGASMTSNKDALRGQFQSLAAGQGGRSNVQRALNEVVSELDKAAPTVQGLYRVRLSINDLIEGKAGSEKSYAKAAIPELIQARNLLDQQMATLSPSFEQYLTSFQRLSHPINRMQAGQELLARGSGGIQDEAGNYVLTPGKFGQQVKNLDELVQNATGFDKATAEGTFLPENLATIRAVDDDLARQSRRLPYGSGGGSHTDSQRGVGERLNDATWKLIEKVPFGQALAGGRQYLKDQQAENLTRALERVLKDPREFRAIASLLPSKQAQLLEQALIRAAGLGANTATPALSGRQPVPSVKAPALAE